MDDIPQELLGRVFDFLGGCDDAARLRNDLMPFIKPPVDPLALLLADLYDVLSWPEIARQIRNDPVASMTGKRRAAIEVLRKAIDAAQPKPVDDGEVRISLQKLGFVDAYADLIVHHLRDAGFQIIRFTASPENRDGSNVVMVEADHGGKVSS